MKLYGEWVEGDYWKLTSDEMKIAFEKAGEGVKKPTAVEQAKEKWRIYHKPIQPKEFWD